MKNRQTLINEILSEWNPIGVPDNIAKEEYKEYISDILGASNETQLINCLENMLNKMELGYDNSNPLHKEEIKQVVLKILSL